MANHINGTGFNTALREHGGEKEAAFGEQHRFRYVDQEERWRQEFKQHQIIENQLAAVKKLSYDPVDYASLVIRTPWKEQPLTDFSYLVADARDQVEKSYFFRVIKRIAIIIALIVILVIGANAVVLWITGVLGAAVAASLYFTINEKRSSLEKATAEAQFEMERLENEERRMNEQAKLIHEQSEDARVSEIEKLLDGDLSAVILKLDNVLPKIGFPFPIDMDIEFYNNIPLVRVWLPNREVIPRNTCELLPSGRVKYTEKELRDINKQYLELCTAILIQIMSVIYAHIPSFDRGYIYGVSKEELQNNCLINISLERENLAAACQAANVLAAAQTLDTEFECDTNLKLSPIEALRPVEWADVERKDIRGINIKIFK